MSIIENRAPYFGTSYWICMHKYLLLQTISSPETRAAQMGAMLADPSPEIIRCSIEQLSGHANLLKERAAIPIGTVEFVREAMFYAGVTEPENLSYHESVLPYLEREITLASRRDVQNRAFVKPVETKIFTGFVYDPTTSFEDLEEHDQEQLKIFLQLPSDTSVWTCTPVTFIGEWRYYVQNRVIIGVGRYDPEGPDDALEPSLAHVQRIIDTIPFSHPYALDIGTLEDGRTAVVEINDAWAIGLYGKTLKPIDYLSFLSDRWDSLFR
jgi:hypothetical protein